jgi:ribosomal protein S6--L-glutamate ligase
MRVVGVTRNPYERNLPTAFERAAATMGLTARMIDLPTIRTFVGGDRTFVGGDRAISVSDVDGAIEVDGLTPFLLYGFPAAVAAYRSLTRTARSPNPVDATLIADDKAATAQRLAAAGVAQVPTQIVALDPAQVRAAAERFGYPVVVKRTHGAQGRWVRRAAGPGALAQAVDELAVEGPGALVVQPEVVESAGRSIRVVVSAGRLLAVTERVAADGEWQTNVAQGARQHRIELTGVESALVAAAVAAIGLPHAGVDLLRTDDGPRVLEVNACPDFTSMQPYYEEDLAVEVLRRLLAR